MPACVPVPVIEACLSCVGDGGDVGRFDDVCRLLMEVGRSVSQCCRSEPANGEDIGDEGPLRCRWRRCRRYDEGGGGEQSSHIRSLSHPSIF